MLRYLTQRGVCIGDRLEIVERLPRNETLNKVLKYKLREMFGSADQGQSA